MLRKRAISVFLMTLSIGIPVLLSSICQVKGIEPPIVEWIETYGGSGSERLTCVIQTYDGGYALAGSTESFGAGMEDFWLVKTDSNGNLEWAKTYGGLAPDRPTAVIQTDDNGYIIVGSTWSSKYNAIEEDVLLIKTDSSGIQQWARTYGGEGRQSAESAIRTNDGGYILAGETDLAENILIIKIHENGDELWSREYGGSGWEEARSIVETRDGGYAIAGWTTSFGAGYYDFWMLKLDADGVQSWHRTFGGNTEDSAMCIVETKDGGFALAGGTWSFGAGSEDFWLVKTDSQGIQQWAKTFGTGDEERALSVIEAGEGGYVLVGYRNSMNPKTMLVRTDSSGNHLWTGTYGDKDNAVAMSIILTEDKHYILGGSTCFFAKTEGSFWLVKLTSESPNQKPTAYIDLISPSRVVEGENVYFEGHGSDPDGSIVQCRWESSRDGYLSDEGSFTTSELSVGTHTIHLRVEDDGGLWSDPDTEVLEVTAKTSKEYWAIIVCGSRQSILYPLTDRSFDENAKSTYRLLTRYLDYDDDHIFYVAPFNDIGVDLTWKRKGDDDVLRTIRHVATLSDSNDVVFFYYTGHGRKDVLDAGLFDINASVLDGNLDRIACDKMVVVIQSCKSGSFINDLDDEPNRIIITSTDATHDSYSQRGNASYFTYGFINSFVEKDNGNLVADTREPYGMISISEVFIYAREQDQMYIKKKEFPKISRIVAAREYFIYEQQG